MTNHKRRTWVHSAVSVLLLGLTLPSSLRAQGPVGEGSDPPTDWSVKTEIGASVFFGASDQTTITTKVGSVRESARTELEGDFSYLYGESTDDEGNTFVNKRSWSVGSTMNYRGFSRVNPYAFVSALSSLEKKIEVRYQGGAGAKFSALDSDVSRLDFAVAILAEETQEKSDENGDAELLARWTGELLFRRSFSEDRTLLEATMEYNPVFDEFDNYTIEAETSLSFRLSEIVSLKLSVEDNYDSRAKRRGARDNNDGRVLFSVLAAF